jgi:serine/threonine protein kinase
MKLVKGNKTIQDWIVLAILFESDSRSMAMVENSAGQQAVLIVDSIPNFGDFSLKKVKEYRSLLLSLQDMPASSCTARAADFRIFRRSDESYYDVYMILDSVEPLSLHLKNHAFDEQEQKSFMKELATALETYHAQKICFGPLHPDNIFCNAQGQYCLGLPQSSTNADQSEKEDYAGLARAFCEVIDPQLQNDADSVEDYDEYILSQVSLSKIASPSLLHVIETALDNGQGYDNCTNLLADLQKEYVQTKEPEVISLSAADLKKDKEIEIPSLSGQQEEAADPEESEEEESGIQDMKVHKIFDNVLSTIASFDPNQEETEKESPKEKLSNMKKSLQESLAKKEEEKKAEEVELQEQPEPEIRLQKKVVRQSDGYDYEPKVKKKRKHPLRALKRVLRICILLIVCLGLYKGYQYAKDLSGGSLNASAIVEKVTNFAKKILNPQQEASDDSAEQSQDTSSACEAGQVYNYYSQSCEWISSNEDFSDYDYDWSQDYSQNDQTQNDWDTQVPEQSQNDYGSDGENGEESLPESFISDFKNQIEQNAGKFFDYYQRANGR